MKKLLLVVVVTLNTFLAKSQSISFNPYTIYQIKNPTTLPENLGFKFVESGDFDGDGDDDIIGATTAANDPAISYTLFVWKNNTGVLSPTPLMYTYGYGTEPGEVTAITVDNMNSDSKDEIVVAFANARVKVFALENNNLIEKSSMWTNNANTNVVVAPNGISTGDLDGDGRKDIAVSHWTAGWISVLYNENNNFSFTKFDYPMIQGGRDQVLIGRLDNDNYNSLIYMRGQGLENDVEILRIGSNRIIQQSKFLNLLDPNAIPHGIAVGNPDNSTNRKLAITSGGNMPNAWYSLSNGNMLQNTTQTFHNPETVRFGNLTGDGRDELVILHGGYQNLSVHNMLTYQVMYFDVPYASSYQPTGMTIGDFNGDGKKDIALANYLYGLIILYNTSMLDVDDVSRDIAISVYPNPASDYIIVKTTQKVQQIELYDSSGRKIQEIKNSSKINIANQSDGVYLLKVVLENGEILSKKIIKK